MKKNPVILCGKWYADQSYVPLNNKEYKQHKSKCIPVIINGRWYADKKYVK